ncbi:MAG: electron transport complex subunit RsxC, partial [Acutalibacteraceae bacterium]
MSKIVDGVLSPVKKGRGGIFVAHHKNTADKPVERMPHPHTVVLPMNQHIGAPCTPLVKVGDYVKAGQKIGDTDKFVSAPIHASVSGTVKSVGDIYLANGMVCTGVTIESDGEMVMSEEIKPPVVNSKADFIKAVRESGLVGLGGAGFPTHVKLSYDESKNVDTLIINAAECEPYITVDYR